jgi:hypothetical protein
MTAFMLAASWLLVSATGSVTYKTATEVFVDAGAKHGVTVGQTLSFERRGRPSGTCVVVSVSPSRTVCQGAKIGVGDTVVAGALSEPPAPAPRPPPKRAAVRDPAEVAARRAQIAAVAVPMVPHVPLSSTLTTRTTLGLRQQAWWSSTTGDSVFARPALSFVSQTSLPLFIPLTASANVLVQGDVLAPANQRFRPDDPIEVYVWDAALSSVTGPVVGSVGRFRLRQVPGAPIVDGGQLGARVWDDRVEVGVYGGAIPDVITTAPGLNRLTAGLYSAFRFDVADAITLMPRLSGGVLSAPDGSALRVDVGGQLQALWRGIGFIGGSLRGAANLSDGSGFVVEQSSADLLLNPVTWWSLAASHRLVHAPALDLDKGDVVPALQRSQHGNVTTTLSPLPHLSVGATAGAGLNETTGLLRAWVGPELGFPSLLGDAFGLDLGYRLEAGDWPGQSAWVGARVQVPSTLVVVRLMGSELQAVIDNYREVGVLLLTETAITSSVSLSSRINATQGIPMVTGSYRASPTILFGDVFLAWRW